MIHPNTELRRINDVVGVGVFASCFIPRGTIVYVKDPLELEISPEQFAAFVEPLRSHVDRYSYIDERGFRIVSWDLAKYVNHCCQCNTMSTGYGFEIAIRDIQAGEELTDEYGLFNLPESMALCCDKAPCRKRVAAEDAELYADAWDETVQDAMKQMAHVDQPLWPLLDDETILALERWLDTGQGYRSIRSLRHSLAAA